MKETIAIVIMYVKLRFFSSSKTQFRWKCRHFLRKSQCRGIIILVAGLALGEN